MDSLILKQSIVAALICGVIFTAFSFGTYYTSIESFAGFNFLYKFLPVVIIVLLLLGFNLRKRMGGFMSFKEAIRFTFLAYVIYETVEVLVTFILFNRIDPMLTQKTMEVGIRTMKNYLQSVGTPQANIDKTIADIRKQQEATGHKNLILGYGQSLIWDFIKSLLVAVIVKKERPADLDDIPQPAM